MHSNTTFSVTYSGKVVSPNHKSVGFTKNCFDLTNITITIILSFVFAGHLVGVGIGTVLAMIGVGRTIAVFNHFTYRKTKVLAGLED